MDLKKILIGAGVVVVGYQAWKTFSKPKTPKVEKKSSATGDKSTLLKYNVTLGKVMKPYAQGFDSRYVALNQSQQPRVMSWYWLNDRWIWTKWDGKLDYKDKVPNNYLIK